MTIAVLTAATDSLFSREGLLIALGGAASILASLGLLLLLPLYLTQRREVERLVDWMDREPDAGTTEFRAISPGEAAPRTGGRMTPAERVTSERPALARIGTAERAALELEQAPFWRRVIERGPRHPLVITLLAIVAAVAIFFAANLIIDANDGAAPTGKEPIDRGSVSVVVLNASPFPGLAGNVAEDVTAARFVVTKTGAASKAKGESVVRFAPGFQREARSVARELEIRKVEEFDAEAQATAEGAHVVVVVGEDLAKGENKLGGESSGESDKP